MKPNFLFIGPDKTGSSWLYEILRQHPECYVPAAKDIYFFDRYYERGMEWYLSFFKAAPPAVKAVGEICHDYLFSPLAAERIARDLPEVKLMTCLRSPLERSMSHYLYMIRSGRTKLSFAEAIRDYPEIRDNSLYYRHLSAYYRLFPRDRILVLFFDRLVRDPRAFAGEVFAFLGISFPEGIAYHEKVRPASYPRSFLLARILKGGAERAREFGLANLVGAVKNSRAARSLYKPYRKEEKPEIPDETRAQLREIFQEDLHDLERLLGADLKHWLNERP